jgi:FkbM family methyltransferase
MLRQLVRQLIALVDHRLGTDFLWAQQLARRVTPRVSSGHARIKVFFAGVLFGSQRWRRPITLSLDGPDGRVPFTVTDYAGYKVLHEVFYGGEYDVNLPEAPHSILDLGGHVGASVLFFRRKWPSADVTVVEANPQLVPVLRANLRTLGVTVRHAAVAAHEGKTGFMPSQQSWSGRTSTDGECVPAITLDRLLDGPVDLMKIDIEGAEFEALPACSRLSNARVVVGELHARQGSGAVDGALEAFEGFDVASRPDGTGVHTLFKAVRLPS